MACAWWDLSLAQDYLRTYDSSLGRWLSRDKFLLSFLVAVWFSVALLAMLSPVAFREDKHSHSQPEKPVSLDGIYLGQPKKDFENRDVSCQPYGAFDEIEFDEQDRVSWVAGNGYLETPKGCLHPIYPGPGESHHSSKNGFCNLQYQREILRLGEPDSKIENPTLSCWTYSAWKLKIKFSPKWSRVELGMHRNG